MSKSVAWGEAHRREALRRTYEIAAELVGTNRKVRAAMLVVAGEQMAASEDMWKQDIIDAFCDVVENVNERADREVRRVRDLAEGRKVRETVWRVEACFFDDLTLAQKHASEWGFRVNRVTRIRRA